MDKAYWEISGPRRYLNIPTPVPNRWRAAVTYGNYPNVSTVIGWGATEDEAKTDAQRQAAALGSRADGSET